MTDRKKDILDLDIVLGTYRGRSIVLRQFDNNFWRIAVGDNGHYFRTLPECLQYILDRFGWHFAEDEIKTRLKAASERGNATK